MKKMPVSNGRADWRIHGKTIVKVPKYAASSGLPAFFSGSNQGEEERSWNLPSGGVNYSRQLCIPKLPICSNNLSG